MLTSTQVDILHPTAVNTLAPGHVIVHNGLEQTVVEVSAIGNDLFVETNLDTLRFARNAKVAIVL